jgi:hypothetical protein
VVGHRALNHWNHHHLFLDKPAADWFHAFPSSRSNYNAFALNDPTARSAITRAVRDGWFDTTMPT